MRQLVGASGSGLTRELTRLYQSTPGAVMLTAESRSHLTYLRETVAEELAFGLEQRGVPAAEMQRRVEQVAAALDLSDLLDSAPNRLSGGQTRRLAIGTVLVLDAPLVLLDDPFAGLDPPSRTRLAALLPELDTEVVVAGHQSWLPQATTRWIGEEPAQLTLPAAVVPGEGVPVVFPDVVGSRGAVPRRWWRPRGTRPATFEVGPVDVAIPPGGVVWLRGANGSGKSTLMRAMAGLDGAPPPPVTVGLLLQDPHDQVIDTRVDRQVPDAHLRERLGLNGEEHPLDLSQRGLRLAQFAAELARNPVVLLADEPDVGLDVSGRNKFHDELARYLRGGGAVLLSCHDESFVAEVRGYAQVGELELVRQG